MKRGATNHPKMIDLARRLHIPLYAAVGLMEMLWHWSRVHAPQGDPGRWGALGVAQGCAWGGDPHRLLAAMVGAGWLDEAPAPHHFVIHDIQAHADNSWKQFLYDQGLTWWDGSDPRSGKAGRPAKPKQKEISRNLSEISRKSPVPVPEPVPEPVIVTPPTPSAPKKPFSDRFDYRPAFQEFWPTYPRRIGKAAAERKYQAVCKSPERHQEIMAGLRAQLPELAAREPQYIPHPATWLNQGRWEDEPQQPSLGLQRPGGSGPTTTFAERKEERMMQKFYEGLGWELKHEQ